MAIAYRRSIILCALLISFNVCTAGSLQPTAAPGATMKTLDEVQPGTAIPGGSTSISYVIMSPGNYYLAGNRTFTAGGEGILINANNVTLDLKGFTLSGTASSLLNGINIAPGYKNIEIRNGTVTGFAVSGISDSNQANQDIRIINVQALSNRCYGIRSVGKSVRVENCLVANNTNAGINAGENSIIKNCMVRNNTSSGISVMGYSTVTGCNVYGNTATGIFAPGQGCIIFNNNCHENNVYGIIAAGQSTITGNNCKNNGGGIEAGGLIKDNFVGGSTHQSSDGFHALTGSTVINNTATNNIANGFKIELGCSVIGNNAYGNGSLQQYGHPYGFDIAENCLVDQNVSYGNAINMDTLVNCTVPNANHAP